MKRVLLSLLLSGCSLAFGDLELPPCATNDDCEVLNERRREDLQACRRYQCEASRCVLSLLDRDDDQFVDVACGGRDCDDADPTIHPLAFDLCGDGIDNDCLAAVDDADADGFSCLDYVSAEGAMGTDCNDNDAEVYPGAADVCDGEVTSCVMIGEDDDGDGFFNVDSSCSGVTPGQRDCDDRRAGVNPDATEACNDRDDDCDGFIDNSEDLDDACQVQLGIPSGQARCMAGACVDTRCDQDGQLDCGSGCQDPSRNQCFRCGNACLAGARCDREERDCSVRPVGVWTYGFDPASPPPALDITIAGLGYTPNRVFIAGNARTEYTWDGATRVPGAFAARLIGSNPTDTSWFAEMPAEADGAVEVYDLGVHSEQPQIGGSARGAMSLPDTDRFVLEQRTAWSARLTARQTTPRVSWVSVGGDQTSSGRDEVLAVGEGARRSYLAGIFRNSNADFYDPVGGETPTTVSTGRHLFVSAHLGDGSAAWEPSVVLFDHPANLLGPRSVVGVTEDGSGRLYVGLNVVGPLSQVAIGGMTFGSADPLERMGLLLELDPSNGLAVRSQQFARGNGTLDEIAPSTNGVWVAGTDRNGNLLLRRYVSNSSSITTQDQPVEMPEATWANQGNKTFRAIARHLDEEAGRETVVVVARMQEDATYTNVNGAERMVPRGHHLLVVEFEGGDPRLRDVVLLTPELWVIEFRGAGTDGERVWLGGDYGCDMLSADACATVLGQALPWAVGFTRAPFVVGLEI